MHFDYWVLIDEQSVSTTRLNLLKQKLFKIETWSKEVFNQSVNFFILGINQLKLNNFSSIDDESSGTAQKAILKEEFYRTFIMIGGKIPYWAVLPPNLSEYEYNQWINELKCTKHFEFNPKDFIDIGYTTDIPKEECFGALLWQAYKSRHDPIKSMIKASLITYYYLYGRQKEALLCEVMKKKIPEHQMESHLIDPYAIVFEKVINFYEISKSKKTLELVKTCIFLRLCGYPLDFVADEDSPKRRLLLHYIKIWGWDEENVTDLKYYAKWGEKRHKELEKKILKKISYLYKLIIKSKDKSDTKFEGISDLDFAIMKNKLSCFIQVKDKKLPYASAFLRAKANHISINLSCYRDGAKCEFWKVYNDNELKLNKEYLEPLFIGNGLLSALGWIVLNKLCRDSKNLLFSNELNKNLMAKRILKILGDIYSIFQYKISNTEWMQSLPTWRKMIILLNYKDNLGYEKEFSSAEFLIKNNWGEIYFDFLDLSSIENYISKCYEIAMMVWNYFNNIQENSYEYQIYRLDNSVEENIQLMIRDFLGQFRKGMFDKGNCDKGVCHSKPVQSLEQDNPFEMIDEGKPFLDQF